MNAKPSRKFTSFEKGAGSNTQHSFGSRLPPQAIESEESVLGSILLDNDAINTALEKVRSDDFYRASHREIFEAMTMLSEKREPIDVVTLVSELRKRSSIEQCGGIEYITRLATLVPSAANVGFYAKSVRESALRRRVIHEATEVINEAFTGGDDIDAFIDSTEQRILAVSENRVGRSFYRVSEIVQDSIRQVEQLYDLKQTVTGVSTGLEDLNKITAGFQPSDLIILAARPSMGKTALALCIAQNVGIHDNKNVAVFSLEMSKEQLVLRMLCSEARVDNSKVRVGQLAERDFPKLVEAASKIAEAQIFIDDTPALSVTELRAKARRLHREHPLSLIVVDYLQLMRSPAYMNSREQEISDISRSLKSIAKELRVPVLALSQLNRSLESRTDKRPMMSDLRESGAIEQDADVIAFIYRDEVYNPESAEKGMAELLISKQRNGPTGMVRLSFFPEYTRFENYAAPDQFAYASQFGSDYPENTQQFAEPPYLPPGNPGLAQPKDGPVIQRSGKVKNDKDAETPQVIEFFADDLEGDPF